MSLGLRNTRIDLSAALSAAVGRFYTDSLNRGIRRFVIKLSI